MIVGYHYTTFDAWTSIRTEGLKLFPLKPKDLEVFRVWGIKEGIWIYPERQEGSKLRGLLAERTQQYRTPNLVELEVRYEEEKSSLRFILQQKYPLTTKIELYHNGWFDHTGKMWHNQEPFELLQTPIPTKQIKLIRTFSSVTLLKSDRTCYF